MKIKFLSILILGSLILSSCASLSVAQFSEIDNETNEAINASAIELSPAATVANIVIDVSNAEPASDTPVTPYYPIVDTMQSSCYGVSDETACPSTVDAYFGQDAQYSGNQASYQDNGDGTVTDLVTGLMWQQDPGEKMTYEEAAAGADSFVLAGYDDWRLPTIKELYSLILFDGQDVSTCPNGTCSAVPFIDTRYFHFQYGDISSGERAIDSQFASSTLYGSTTMNGEPTMFGVNFADGRIKGYGLHHGNQEKTFFVLYVRGGAGYGENRFVDQQDGTIQDLATGLTWMQSDSNSGMDWGDALAYCEDLSLAGHDDWRLPNAKELQSIVDYSRSPDITNSAAIDPIFNVSTITDEMGNADYPYYWTGTSHVSSDGHTEGVYIAFGEAPGKMNGQWMDVHGAGAQRSDPKAGSAADFPDGRGPQGDAIRINNYVRCVRAGEATLTIDGITTESRPSIQFESNGVTMNQTQPATNQPGPQSGATPPEAALQACATSTQGDDCQFNTPVGEVSGTCQLIRQQLACVPQNAGPNP